jgi:hypothetical protein
MAACHPIPVTDPSEVNRKVKHPVALIDVAEIVPGLVLPENVPKSGAAVEFPSYTYRKSQQPSVPKLEKTACMHSPGVEGQYVTV